MLSRRAAEVPTPGQGKCGLSRVSPGQWLCWLCTSHFHFDWLPEKSQRSAKGKSWVALHLQPPWTQTRYFSNKTLLGAMDDSSSWVAGIEVWEGGENMEGNTNHSCYSGL